MNQNITRNDDQHYTLCLQSLHVMFFDVTRLLKINELEIRKETHL